MKLILPIPNNHELYAICVNDSEQDNLQLDKMYRVQAFESNEFLYPSGVRLFGIETLFYVQRFQFFWVNLN